MAPARKPSQKESIVFQPSILGGYCWWKESCTTWDETNPVKIGITYQPFHLNWCRIPSINSILVSEMVFPPSKSPRLKIYLIRKEEPMEKQNVPLKFEVFVAWIR